MQHRFNKYCEGFGLAKNAKILLALSGGLDSMALLHLLHNSGYHIEVAHCNFNLRAEESDEDARFVAQICESLKLPLYIKRFDTKAYAQKQGVSIQMAARDLRYNWFEELRSEKGLDFIATAHHADDLVESVLINLSRGTGIKGLQGIKALNAHLIRPLLFTDREVLEFWVNRQGISYREDSSNASTKYSRNKIRHHVVPVLKEINPSLSTTFGQNSLRFEGAESNLNFFYEQERAKLLVQKGEKLHIDLKILKKYPSPIDVLFYFLADYGFNDWYAIQNLVSSNSGKSILSSNHQLLKNREELILAPVEDKTQELYFVTERQTKLLTPVDLRLSVLSAKNYTISKDSSVAAIAYDKLQFPLCVRKWKRGDVFYPIGMKGKKKISDFFIDKKLSLFEKENTWLLCSGDDIVWVIGYRMDDRFKLVENSQKVYLAQLNVSDHE